MKTLFKSELLNKTFDTEEECLKAEKEFEVAEAKKKEVSDARKEEADKVKALIIARIKTEQEVNKGKKEACKAYLSKCDELDSKLDEVKDAQAKALQEFCKKYGAFHETITLGDATYTCDYSNRVSHSSIFDRLFDYYF